MTDMAVCMVEGEPLVWTFEFPGAEYVCVPCGAVYGPIGVKRVAPTPTLTRRHTELKERYEIERARRAGVEPPAPPPQDVPPPVCGGCGRTADPDVDGRLERDGKPQHWYSKTVDGVTTYACKQSCIPSGEPAIPW